MPCCGLAYNCCCALPRVPVHHRRQEQLLAGKGLQGQADTQLDPGALVFQLQQAEARVSRLLGERNELSRELEGVKARTGQLVRLAGLRRKLSLLACLLLYDSYLTTWLCLRCGRRRVRTRRLGTR